jgi:peptidoglycan hydrolase-like protein with peptidoglycan-binding domain
MGWVEMGVTNPNFVAPSPSQVSAAGPGQPLIDAAQALAASMATGGTPSEHVSDPSVLAFQQAWNADPVSNINGSSSQLSDDGAYGPNTQAALASFGAYTVPAVNSGTAPVITPPVTPSPSPVAPVVPGTTPAKSSDLVPLLAIAAAVAAAAYLLFFRKKRRRSSSKHSTSLVLRSNPRRRRAFA